MSRLKTLLLLASLLALTMLFVACGGAEGDATEPAAPPAGEDGDVSPPADGGDVEEPDTEAGGDLAGTVVTVFGPFVEDEQARFEQAIAPFEEETGVDVQYEGSSEFESLILVRTEGGDPPDVAALPQPGLMRDLAAAGHLVPLPDSVISQIESNYAPVWLDLGSFEGTPYGIFHRVNVKSLVWYPEPAFTDAGYTAPESWEELQALTQQIIDDGGVPWCIGMEAGGGTGWVATDWVEDLMLRLHGPDVYDQWVNHEIPFNDPQVAEAVETMGEIWLDPAQVYGGTAQILTTPYQDAASPMFEDPPACWLHRQGNFVTGFFPQEVQDNLEEHVGIFAFPPINEEFGAPMLGGGDQYAMFRDRPEVVAFMEYLATGQSAESWAAAGGAIFPHQDLSLDVYPNAIERQTAEFLVEAEVFRFDGSDLMPAAVGAGSFWTGMVDYVSGADLDTVLQNIEDSWPAE